MIPEVSRSQESGLSFVMLCLLFTIRENTKNFFFKQHFNCCDEKKTGTLEGGQKYTRRTIFALKLHRKQMEHAEAEAQSLSDDNKTASAVFYLAP